MIKIRVLKEHKKMNKYVLNTLRKLIFLTYHLVKRVKSMQILIKTSSYLRTLEHHPRVGCLWRGLYRIYQWLKSRKTNFKSKDMMQVELLRGSKYLSSFTKKQMYQEYQMIDS